MRLNFVIAFSLFSQLILSQSNFNPCGSNPSPKEVQLLTESIKKFSTQSILKERSLTNIPMKIWVIESSDQSFPLTNEEIKMVINEANAAFSDAHLEHQICDSISRVINDDFADFSKSQEYALKQLYYVENNLNFYLTNTLVHNNGDTLCGYAQFPGSSDLIVMDKHCLLDGSTFIHELGHFWGLYHTHGTTNQYVTHELVNGNNCVVSGDDICDTPADPNLKNYVDEDCIYSAQIFDGNGDLFAPDPFNYMSYSPASCKTRFTDGQVDRIEYVHQYLRNHLNCSSLSTEMSVLSLSNLCDTAATVIYDYQGDDADVTVRWDLNANGYIDYEGQIFEVHYDNIGNYDILMSVEKNGEESTNYRKNAVQLFETHHLPFHLIFKSGLDNFKIDNPDQDDTWFVTKLNSIDEDNAITIDNYHNYQRGEYDAIILPPIRLDGQTFADLKFKVAYAWHGINYDDQLDIAISADCGESFTNIYSKYGSELASVPYQADGQWVPINDSEWREETIDISQYLGQDVIIRFTNINDFGNQLYLNDIMIDGDPTLAHESLRLTGRKLNTSHNQLKWSISEFNAIDQLWLEASIDGRIFEKINTIDFVNFPQGEFSHRYGPERDFYYRIAGLESGSEIIFSDIKYISGQAESMATIYPNPVTQNLMINLKIIPDTPTKYTGDIFNHNGQLVQKFNGVLNENNGQIQVDVQNLSVGVYYIQVKVDSEMFNLRFAKI